LAFFSTARRNLVRRIEKPRQSLMELLGLFYDCWGLATQGIFGKPLGNLGKIGAYAK
jgi:hypothetical protein